MPFVPQVVDAWATQVFEGSGAPAGTSPQVPMAFGSAHDLHMSEHAVEQQMPCAQKPEVHSAATEQNAPTAFWPHEPLVQVLRDTHCMSFVQAPKQRAPLQAKGAHGRADGARHWPVLVHVDGGV
jgi:hypothetical protein